MARALVTGAGGRVGAVATLLRQDIVRVTVAEPARLSAAHLGDAVDYYVQLPVIVRPDGDNLVTRVRSFLTAGLLARFAVIELLLPVLADGASVVLVSGNVPGESALPDDRHSRLAMLRVLAHATRAELAVKGVTVTVVGGDRTDEEIVACLLGRATHPTARLAEDPPLVSGKQYEDWRTEVMGLVGQDG
jgi:hypothetical protein